MPHLIAAFCEFRDICGEGKAVDFTHVGFRKTLELRPDSKL